MKRENVSKQNRWTQGDILMPWLGWTLKLTLPIQVSVIHSKKATDRILMPKRLYTLIEIDFNWSCPRGFFTDEISLFMSVASGNKAIKLGCYTKSWKFIWFLCWIQTKRCQMAHYSFNLSHYFLYSFFHANTNRVSSFFSKFLHDILWS